MTLVVFWKNVPCNFVALYCYSVEARTVFRLDFRRSLESGLCSSQERGLISRTAAGNGAQVVLRVAPTSATLPELVLSLVSHVVIFFSQRS